MLWELGLSKDTGSSEAAVGASVATEAAISIIETYAELRQLTWILQSMSMSLDRESSYAGRCQHDVAVCCASPYLHAKAHSWWSPMSAMTSYVLSHIRSYWGQGIYVRLATCGAQPPRWPWCTLGAVGCTRLTVSGGWHCKRVI